MQKHLFSLSVAIATITVTPAPCATSGITNPSNRESVDNYRFEDGIEATRLNDHVQYFLVGDSQGLIPPLRDAQIFIVEWLRLHPNATVTPISRALLTREVPGKQIASVYIWVEDGAESLNIDLVSAGLFTGKRMNDFIDLAAEIRRAVRPIYPELLQSFDADYRFERLISDADYRMRLLRVSEAEQSARRRKLGVWSHPGMN